MKKPAKKKTPAKRPPSQADDSVRVDSIPIEDAGSQELAKDIHDRLVAMQDEGYEMIDVFPVNDWHGVTKQIIITGTRCAKGSA